MASTAPSDPVRGDAGRKTTTSRAFDAQLAVIALELHGVFLLDELCALGLSASAIRHRARAGRLHRVHQRVYSLMPVPLLSVSGRYRAAVLACTGAQHPAALSHRSAADLHGLRACQRRTVEVIVPGRSPHIHDGVQAHRSLNLAAPDMTTVQGVAVTTIPRTLLDLAAVVPARGLERALDQAENLRAFDLRELVGQLARNPRHPGAGRLQATLGRYEIGSSPTASELEERFLGLCRFHGFPIPEVNAFVDPDDHEPPLRPDFIWRDRRTAVEVDGMRTHFTRHAYHDDRRRDQRLHAAGWRPIRFTWWQVAERPDEVAAILRRLLHHH